MNVYDFDKTIYRHDSSVDFYLFNLKKQPTLLMYLPMQLLAMLRYKLKLGSKTAMKSQFYRYFQSIHSMDDRLIEFWKTHQQYLMPYYLKQKLSDDVIISASPEFMLKPICDQLNVHLIASMVDPQTGHSDMNCYGEEKVVRFRKLYPKEEIEAFYSDSLSDSPLAVLAQKAYLVTDDLIQDWPTTSK